MQHKCSNCMYAEKADEKGNGFICHRFPPTPQLVPQHNALTGESGMSVQAFHPPVGPENWCGEFEPEPSGGASPDKVIPLTY